MKNRIFAKWVELTLGYKCNCRCAICYIPDDLRGVMMDDQEIKSNLIIGYTNGVRKLWLSGGEPTISKSLFKTVKLAKNIGYKTIKIQSNGIMFSYRDFCVKCLEHGINEFNISIKGHNAEEHDSMTRTKGSYELLLKGIKNLKELGAYVEADILITTRATPHLTEMVSGLHSLGVNGFDFWYPCSIGSDEKEFRELLPPLCEVGPALSAALRKGRELNIKHLHNYHVPACYLPGLKQYCVPASELDMMVCNPGRRRFILESSPMEKGTFFEECEECRWESKCSGFRRDYIEIFGETGLPPKVSGKTRKTS